MNTRDGFPTIVHQADFCVVGGGLAGLSAAVAAARHGAHVVLMQDRPMLGGNASSEVRMWVCGAHGKNNQETGLVEELFLENLYRNPDRNYSIWDGILYEKAAYNENIELLLNCTCTDCEMQENTIKSVTGWQMTTQTRHRVLASLFADCSGDSVLAPLTGAEFRIGREARAEFGEDIAPEEADRKTMGMSCMIQAREETHPSTFTAPKWAYHYTKEDLPHRIPDLESPMENFWYLELGGESDIYLDAEKTRDELLRTAYGIWDFVKNDPENKEKNANWRLDWMGILPGKRESRRYVGDHILTQHEVRAEGRFEDLVAYGGWSMDDHDPAGFKSRGVPTVYHPAPSPYGIPYRSMYSVNIENLMFAGRNISVTHTAMSSTRVMATCAAIGQAVGTAASIAVRDHLSPRGVYEKRLGELKQTLMEDDCYLPFNVREVPELTRNARLVCSAPDAENLRNGLDRPIGDSDNGAVIAKGEAITYIFREATAVSHIRIIFDSDLNRETLPECEAKRERNMLHNRPLNWPDAYVPKTLVRSFRLEGVREDGSSLLLVSEDNNYQRFRAFDASGTFAAVRLIPLETWGSERCHIFSFDVR
ncbi:MAG: FAD-dependent oxidoreductase [Lachnospiraceae bacterium]|nr:FAD-dependent oxidoreductase [Lachnospiraceae bacterium]